MTNGEKIKELFPRTPIGVSLDVDGTNGTMTFTTNKDWWEAEYKEPVIRDNEIKDELNRVKDELEPTTKNDLGVDCISRQAVIDGIKEYFHDEYYQRTSIQDCRDCFIEDVLNHLPSVTPQEPRKGHWIESMPGGAEEWCYKCSECNFWKYKKTINLSKFKFCPNCGEDMRGEE